MSENARCDECGYGTMGHEKWCSKNPKMIRMYRVYLNDEECPEVCFETGQEDQIANMLRGTISEFLPESSPGDLIGVEVEEWTPEQYRIWKDAPET